jgi:hypothetical protein
MIHKNLVSLCIIDCCKMDSTQLASARKELRHTLIRDFCFDDDDDFAYILDSLVDCVHESVNLALRHKRNGTYDYEKLMYAMFTYCDEVCETIDYLDDETVSHIRVYMGIIVRQYINIISEANDLSIEMNVD